MSDTSTSTTSSYDDNMSTGHKVVTYVLRSLAWGCTLSAALGASTIIMGVVTAIAVGLLMALAYGATKVFIAFKVDADHIAAIGRVLNNTTARVTGLFTRKAA